MKTLCIAAERCLIQRQKQLSMPQGSRLEASFTPGFPGAVDQCLAQRRCPVRIRDLSSVRQFSECAQQAGDPLQLEKQQQLWRLEEVALRAPTSPDCPPGEDQQLSPPQSGHPQREVSGYGAAELIKNDKAPCNCQHLGTPLRGVEMMRERLQHRTHGRDSGRGRCCEHHPSGV
ncbi:uncharacterized protein LOC124239486 isoform X2 [Equus quagga]|uniref:uncharacterized protein LOC124239486 isoform X2 n=1 Tax=Equus quagga TaxID=89248 RepID=UPI001EE3243E|nr:uncharacterized protein LOC124239486 isoform X2 [Equus quagga]